MPSSFDFETVKVWKDSDILYCQFLSTDINYKLIEEDAEKYLTAIKNLVDNKKRMTLLIDLRNVVGNFTVEAAKLLAFCKTNNINIISEAYVTNSLNGKLLVNSYKRIYEPIRPFEIFDSMNEAIEYCTNSLKNFK